MLVAEDVEVVRFFISICLVALVVSKAGERCEWGSGRPGARGVGCAWLGGLEGGCQRAGRRGRWRRAGNVLCEVQDRVLSGLWRGGGDAADGGEEGGWR